MVRDQGRGKLNWLRRIETEKMQARERGEEISDEEAKRRASARLHRPKLKGPNNDRDPCLYTGAEVVLGQSRISLPNCVALEPRSVHAMRDYVKITKEITRILEEGNVHPDEIRFLCSEFFVWMRDRDEFLVRFGERKAPYRIEKNKLKVSYERGTVALDGYRPIKVKSVGIFEYYFVRYGALC